MNFVAIDFETASPSRNSACELGICIVENGIITQTKSWLIKPPCYPEFNYYNIKVHGITPQDVQNEKDFASVWSEASQLIGDKLLIAHNAAFDSSVLRSSLQHHNLPLPALHYLCSISVAKQAWTGLSAYGLKNLANIHDIQFSHHRAGADAEVCAKISLLAFEILGLKNNSQRDAFFAKNSKRL